MKIDKVCERLSEIRDRVIDADESFETEEGT